MKKLLSTAALVSLLILPVSSFAEKIGFVNVTRLGNEYAKAKGIDKMMEEKVGGAKAEMEKLVSEIKSLEKEIKTNELLMTESKLVASKNKLKDMVIAYREKGAEIEKELQAVRNTQMAEFSKIVMEVTNKYAEEKKYDLIINEGVMFASEKVNITDEILSRLNKVVK